MNKGYRPPNWDNPFHKKGDFGHGLMMWNEQPEFSAFEAGADAMLESLFKMAKESPTGTFVIDSHAVNIFKTIPDEDK